MKYVTLSVVLLAALALGQQWEFEQVDSAGWGVGVQMRRHPDGRLFLCYGDSGGRVRLAISDSVWRYEDVPTESLPQPGSQTFDIGPGGETGVLYLRGGQPRYTCRGDSGWAEVAGCSLGAGERAVLAFEPDGAPGYAQGFTALEMEQFGFAHVLLDGTVWRADTLVVGFVGTQYCLDYRVRPGGVRFIVERWKDEPWLGDDLGFWRSDGGGWHYTYVVGHGGATRLRAVSGAADVDGVVRLCWTDRRTWPPPWPALYYNDGEMVDSVDPPALSALVMDSLRRPLVAYGPPGLRFTFRDSAGWHPQTIALDSVTALDMMLSDSGRPVIAYATSGGVYLARSGDMVGVEDGGEPTGYSSRPTATILSGASGVARLASCVVYDAMGRRVFEPKPGVHFIREGSGARGQGSGRMRKVVIPK